MSKLFEPLTVGGVTLKNRLVVAPMGVIHDKDGGISPSQHDYLVERAKGGFGLIYPSAHTVIDKYETPLTSGNHLNNSSHMERLAKLVEDVHSYGAKFAIQLSPGYGRVNMGPPGITTHVSASPIPAFFYPNQLCKALTVDEIKEILDAARRAAAFAKEAGVDFIEIHSYGGYLLDQFITKCWNHRQDQYGGSLENRLRFTREFTDAVREAVGRDFPMSIKATPEHGFPGGRTLDDEGIELFKILEKWGFAFLHIDTGAYECWNKSIPSEYEKPGCELFAAERLRKEGITIPFLVQGKMNDPILAEKTIASGTADMIALGHQSLADPYWPEKIKEGKFEDINYCICCNECVSGEQICSVNPLTYHENEYNLKTPGEKKRVLVIGGGPGGMYTAKTAADLGYDVTLWEKDNHLGGLVSAAARPGFKIDVACYLRNLTTQVYKSKVDVRLCTMATEEKIDAFNPDAVILAAGAPELIPHIPGITGQNVVSAYDLLMGKAAAGQRVVIMGGGSVGCETGLYLNEMGREVTIVEMLDKIMAQDSTPLNSLQGMKSMLAKSNIKILTSTKVTEIREGSVLVSTSEGNREIMCDTVVRAVGYGRDNTLAAALAGKPYPVMMIGNYNKQGKIRHAVHDGFQAILQLQEKLSQS